MVDSVINSSGNIVAVGDTESATSASDRWRKKSEIRLSHDLKEASRLLGEHILPATVRQGSLIQLPPERAAELREDHPVRWATLVNALRAVHKGLTNAPDCDVALLKIINGLEECLDKHASKQDATLRDAQVEVFEDLANALEAGHTRGYFKLPTGFGKTVLMAVLAHYSGLKTLVIVPKSGLASQTNEKFEKFCPNATFCEQHGKAKEGDGDVVVTTQQFLLAERALPPSERSIDLSKFDLIFLDEAHKALGKETAKIITDEIPKTTTIIGFTATPEYSKTHSVRDILPYCYRDIDTRQGIRMGALAPAIAAVAHTSIDLSSVSTEPDGEYNEREFLRAVEQQGLNKSAIDLYLKKFSGRSLIGFCQGVTHAERCAIAFNSAGIPAAFLSGDTSKTEYDRVIEAYKKGEIKALFSADLLTEGFDAPIASVCFNLSPTSSLVRAEQRGGRVLRLDEANPHKVGVIIDFVFTDRRERSERANPYILYCEILQGSACPPSDELKKSDGERKALNERMSALQEELSLDGLKLVTDFNEMVAVNAASNPNACYPIAPEGWLDIDTVAEKVSRSKAWVLNAARTADVAHKVLWGKYQSAEGAGRSAYYFEPGFGLSLEPTGTKGRMDAGWRFRYQIQNELNITPREFGIVWQELFKQGLIAETDVTDGIASNGKQGELYSPGAQEQIAKLAAGVTAGRRKLYHRRAQESETPFTALTTEQRENKNWEQFTWQHNWIGPRLLTKLLVKLGERDGVSYLSTSEESGKSIYRMTDIQAQEAHKRLEPLLNLIKLQGPLRQNHQGMTVAQVAKALNVDPTKMLEYYKLLFMRAVRDTISFNTQVNLRTLMHNFGYQLMTPLGKNWIPLGKGFDPTLSETLLNSGWLTQTKILNDSQPNYYALPSFITEVNKVCPELIEVLKGK